MKEITVDGKTYVASPAMRDLDPNHRCCTGCAGQYDIFLCDRLQRCEEDLIVWKEKETT